MDKRIRAIVFFLLLCLFFLLLKVFLGNQFTSVEDFQTYIQGYGMAGPLILTVFQAFQVVVPVVPGYLGCASGAVTFGTIIGFICNYVGISAGSVIAYYLAKQHGMRVILMMFSEHTYNEWNHKIQQSKSYDRFLFIATLLPMFPDDFLCYFSGLIKMDTKRFVWIILLGKPWCILAYSVIFGMIN